MLLPHLLAAFVFLMPVTADTQAIAIIPRPVKLTRDSGTFALGAGTVINVTGETRELGNVLAEYLAPATGLRIPVRTGAPAGGGSGQIVLRIDTTLKRLGTEGYTFEATKRRITIRAAGAAGVFYGIQTLRQLLPPAVFRAAPIPGVSWTVPAVRIEDSPRFSWRGAHLDVCRHFMPKEFVKKYIDLLALHKMNHFHWHLTDDQGWRIEIPRYPRLTDVGAWRKQTIVGRMESDTANLPYDGIPHGGFYTQDDIREVVAYAAARFITVVPEIEMPGHAHAAIAAYPELGNTGEHLEVSQRWGVDPYILNPSDSTIQFMQNVLTDVMTLFPSHYIHTGGDEAIKTQWKTSALAQSRIQALGLHSEDELQSWFTKQMDAFLTAHGRSLIGWDEILEGGLAPGAVVMSWRGIEGGIAAARAGHDVVMAPTNYTYFDYYQSRDSTTEPLAIGGYLPLDTVYAYDPVPADLPADAARHILGAQGQVWTEYIPDPKRVEYMAFPRLVALAEVVWTPRDRKDFADFSTRLGVHRQRLAALDVNYRK